jgi:hypothetical protein
LRTRLEPSSVEYFMVAQSTGKLLALLANIRLFPERSVAKKKKVFIELTPRLPLTVNELAEAGEVVLTKLRL